MSTKLLCCLLHDLKTKQINVESAIKVQCLGNLTKTEMFGAVFYNDLHNLVEQMRF